MVHAGFEGDVDTGHHRVIAYGVAGGPRAIEWFGAIVKRMAALRLASRMAR